VVGADAYIFEKRRVLQIDMLTHSHIDELAYEETYVSPDVLLLEQLDKLINQQFRERKDPGFYASELACSERWLSDLCKLYRNKTLFGLIQDRLVKESKLLLGRSRLSAKVIAYELGFEDPAYFCRFFKKMTGTTTKAYRRSCYGTLTCKI